MKHSSFLFSLWIAGSLALTGCQLSQAGSGEWEAALSGKAGNALVSQLEHDAWRPKVSWSRYDEAERFRWSFGSDSLDETIADAGPQSLSALAGRDSLIGWNAAIVWGRRDPAAAGAVAPVLERLVSERPAYVPEAERIPGGTETSLQEDGPMEILTLLMAGWKWVSGKPDGKPASGSESGRETEKQISTSMQGAAAEAWCLVLAESAPDPLEALAPAGRMLERNDLPDHLRRELFRSVARWVPPASIPSLEQALRESDGRMSGKKDAPVDLRRAAMEACLIYAEARGQRSGIRRQESEVKGQGSEAGSRGGGRRGAAGGQSEGALEGSTAPGDRYDASLWPSTIENCRRDRDARVRRTFGRWSAVVRHPDAFQVLKSQLLDTEIRVREDALISLGLLGSDEARTELQQQAERPEERVREFAVRGLARWGVADLAPYADDESSHVRHVVAEEAGGQPSVESARLLSELLVDSHAQVQAAAVEAIEGWPDHLAVPLLLGGMRDSSRATRQRCLSRFRQRTGIQEPFPVDAPRTQRVEAADEIARTANLPTGFFEHLRDEGLRASPRVDELHAAEVESFLRDVINHPPQSPVHAAALERLKQLSATDVPVIERFLLDPTSGSSAAVDRDVLPKLSPAYAALLDLENADVFVRRRGAQNLARLGTEASLSRLTVRRLGDRLVHEQDRLVWRYAMSAVMHDGTEETARVAELAVNHTWPDIRILGCEYAARHGRPQYAAWLLPLLHDSNKELQLAAVRAAGRCRNPIVLDGIAGDEESEPLPGLRSLLTDSDPRVQFAAAASLSHLGDSQGMQELVRLSFQESPAVREQVVREMGQTGQTRFVEHLVRLGWTEPHAGVKRAILESLDLLVPAEKRPELLGEKSGDDDKISSWVDW